MADWQAGHARVVAAIPGGATVFIFSAEAAVVTLPLGVLKAGDVVFDPPLARKSPALERLQTGTVVKLALTFRQPFWPDDDFGSIHAFDEAIPTWHSEPV